MIKEVLEVNEEMVSHRLEALQMENRIERFPLIISGEKKSHLWFKPFFNAEVGIANELNASGLIGSPIDPKSLKDPKFAFSTH